MTALLEVGVLLAVLSSIPVSPFPSPPTLEVVCIKLLLKHTILLCLVYIPPSAGVEYHKTLIQFLESLLSLGHYVIILGDFNAPDICWSTFCGTSITSNILCDFIVANGLEQHVDFPTHSGGNTLDLVLCSSPDVIQNVSRFSSSSLLSDHFPLSSDLIIDLSNPACQCAIFMDLRIQ